MLSLKALAPAFIALGASSLVHVQASLFIVHPLEGSTCSGGQPCPVQWLDDGTSPLNSDIGAATIGLFTGDMQLVQTIPAVDVGTTQSLTFMPIPGAGPNSNDYYLAFTSINLEINGTAFTGYSPFFSLNNMTGSFSSPLASATSSIPIASSLSASSASEDTGVLSTVTIGVLSTSLPAISTLSATSASSGFSTSTLSSPVSITTSSGLSSTSGSSSSSISPSNSASGASSSSNSARSLRTIPLPPIGVLSLALFLSL